MLFVTQPTFIVVKDIKSASGSEYPIVANSIIRLGRMYICYSFLLVNTEYLKRETNRCKLYMHQ